MSAEKGSEGVRYEPDVRVRKVRTLQGRAKEEALRQNLDNNDLVIVRTSVNSLPTYEIEKIEGDPLTYLQKSLKK